MYFHKTKPDVKIQKLLKQNCSFLKNIGLHPGMYVVEVAPNNEDLMWPVAYCGAHYQLFEGCESLLPIFNSMINLVNINAHGGSGKVHGGHFGYTDNSISNILKDSSQNIVILHDALEDNPLSEALRVLRIGGLLVDRNSFITKKESISHDQKKQLQKINNPATAKPYTEFTIYKVTSNNI